MKYLFSTTLLLGVLLMFSNVSEAQYGSACSDYGLMAYESGGYCKCMSGYVMQDNAFGSQCVSGSSVCSQKFGYGSQYDSLSGSCECSYGYVFGEDSIGRTQCISENDACQNELGFNSRASYGGQCECNYGYVIDGGKCVDGDQVCHSDHGYNSSYDSLSNRCECDNNYTFDDTNQCVKKQNNVYFKLLDINPEDDKELLIKSDYDSQKYIVRVGVGCLSTSLERYEGKNLVVNLGTDFDVDIFDTVVLQDHSQTCSIMSRERTYDDFFPEPEEDISYYTPSAQTYTPPSPTYQPVSTPNPTTPNVEPEVFNSAKTEASVTELSKPETHTDDIGEDLKEEISTTSDFVFVEPEKEKIIEPEIEENFFRRILNFFKSWF